jgi:DNA-binding NarL/FixJ family response regulator
VKSEIISVGIIEDDQQIREGISSYIDSVSDFSCTHIYGSCEEALRKVSPPLPDVVLMDISLNGMSGIEGVRKLKSKYPSLIFIMLTVYEEDNKIFESMRAGAVGYLLKKSQLEKITEAIRDVYNGGAPMTPIIARKVLNYFSSSDIKAKEYNLTPREIEILQQLVKGSRYKMIAQNLFISLDTVRSHIKSIYEKLQVNSKSEAVAKAFKDKLI